jgi:hypothetical protein
MAAFPVEAWNNYFHIGSSSQAPNVSDTALIAWLGKQDSSLGSGPHTNSGSPNYIFSSTKGMRFNAGTATGTIREVGLSSSALNQDMAIRTLVSPAIPKAIDQVLDVYYKFNITPPIIDFTGQVVIDSLTYDYTGRGMELDGTSLNAFSLFTPSPTAAFHDAYDGNIGAITAKPSGTIDDSSIPPVVTNTGAGFIDWTIKFGLDDAIFGGGIRSVSSVLQFGSLWGVQIQFDNASDGSAIPKDDTEVINFDLRMSWVRS